MLREELWHSLPVHGRMALAEELVFARLAHLKQAMVVLAGVPMHGERDVLAHQRLYEKP